MGNESLFWDKNNKLRLWRMDPSKLFVEQLDSDYLMLEGWWQAIWGSCIGYRAKGSTRWEISIYIRVIHYKMHNPTKCIIFSLIISPLLLVSTIIISTKVYWMQLALVELKQQEKFNILTILKKIPTRLIYALLPLERRNHILYKSQLWIQIIFYQNLRGDFNPANWLMEWLWTASKLGYFI